MEELKKFRETVRVRIVLRFCPFRYLESSTEPRKLARRYSAGAFSTHGIVVGLVSHRVTEARACELIKAWRYCFTLIIFGYQVARWREHERAEKVCLGIRILVFSNWRSYRVTIVPQRNVTRR